MLPAGIDEFVWRELMGHSFGRQKYGQAGGLAFEAEELSRMAFYRNVCAKDLARLSADCCALAFSSSASNRRKIDR